MSRGVTNKGVDKFVELTNDKRFHPYLFASAIAHESHDTQQAFFDAAMFYLEILALDYESGADRFGVADLASRAYRLVGGGGGITLD